MARPSPSFANVCNETRELLLRIAELRTLLGDFEKSLQEEYLSRCIFPRIQGGQEIALAIHQLSTRRIGTLVVIEQEMSLEKYARSGTVLNAAVSTTLLLSLFYPGNPLHDGAVIVRGNSVVAAGCVLPLSDNHALFKPRGLA
jgi:diadenylate cyclase